ncbi:MAG: dihydroorotate dehydrogenase electron transfer subunit [Candidatus Bathyarchaeota archaeon]|nr:dihydroorotate dehydrogenase electron transfer subunit [Candidatus Bathyarchaeota archaeon]
MSACHTINNHLRTTTIQSIKTESPTVKTFTFKDKCCAKAKPGQFLMLWIPGVDEIPLSILNAEKNGDVSVSVKNVGEATQAMHRRKIGDIIGVRGPFGNSFSPAKGGVLLVGGGTGLVPLVFHAKKSLSKVKLMAFVVGAKTKGELLFADEIRKVASGKRMEFIETTEDGSCGFKGLCTQPLESLLEKIKFNMIYACGPEQMIKESFRLAQKHKVGFEASLERLMRCAIGLCGSCLLGKYRVCRDGPVFTGKQLEEVGAEFGVSKRDFNGKKVPISSGN